LVTKAISYYMIGGECRERVVTTSADKRCPSDEEKVTCDRKTDNGVVKFITYSLTSKCECRPSVYSRAFRPCSCPDVGKIVERTVCDESRRRLITYQVENLKVNGQCQRKKVRTSVPVHCSNEVNHITGQCDANNRRVEIIESHKFVNCSCEKQVERRICDCKCTPPESKTTCLPNGKTLITSYLPRYNGCSCQFTESKVTRDRVDCNRLNFAKAPPKKVCDRDTCVATYRKTVYEVDESGCGCKPTETVVKETCCCKGGRTETKKCNPIEGIFSVTKTSSVLASGKCLTKVVEQDNQVNCHRDTKEVPVGVCDRVNNVQQWKSIRNYRVGCECKQDEAYSNRPCPCKPSEEQVEQCNPTTCTQIIRSTVFRQTNDGCEPSTSERFEQCCCSIQPSSKFTCDNNVQYRHLVQVKFNADKKECEVTKSTEPIDPDCKTEPVVTESPCDSDSGMKTITTVTQEWVGCQCKRHEDIKRVVCQCPKPEKVTSCDKNSTKTTISVTYKSNDGECKREETVSNEPITCQSVPLRFEGECDSLTCKKDVNYYAEVPINCQCKSVLQATELKDCCCPADGSTSRTFCESGAGDLTTIKSGQVFNAAKASCMNYSEEYTRTIQCVENKTSIPGECNKRVGDKTYRQVKTVFFKRVACECERIVTYSEELCDCKSKVVERCNDGVKETLKYLGAPSTNAKGEVNCVYKPPVVIDRKPVICKKEVEHESDKCDLRTCKRKSRRIEHYKEECACKTKVTESSSLCCCPPEKVITNVCLKNRKKITKQNFTLECDSDDPNQCKCTALPAITNIKQVTCPPPVITPQNCYGDVTYPKAITYYKRDNCKCEKVIKSVPCMREHPCENKLPDKDCAELIAEGTCDSDKSVGEVLCRKTCQTCETCSGTVKYRYVPDRSLQRTVEDGNVVIAIDGFKFPYEPTLHGRQEKVDTCAKFCTQKKRCFSFEVYTIPDSSVLSCTHNFYNTSTFTERFNIQPLVQRGTDMYERYCERKCSDPVVEIKACHERKDGIKVSLVSVTKYRADSNGQCVPKKREIQSSCPPKLCVDIDIPSICKRQRELNHCDIPEVRTRCALTCEPQCRCPKPYTIEGPCRLDELSSKSTQIKRQYRYESVEGVCQLSIDEEIVACTPPCKKEGVSYDPQICANNKRRVIMTRYDQNCKKEQSVAEYNCEGCCPDVDVTVSECHRGKQSVTKTWWVSENNCCRIKTFTEQVSCLHCPKRNMRRGECKLGYRLVYTIWYSVNESRSDGRCQQNVITKREAC
jgi:hypothetical protein